jgi:hypothetical protein
MMLMPPPSPLGGPWRLSRAVQSLGRIARMLTNGSSLGAPLLDVEAVEISQRAG